MKQTNPRIAAKVILRKEADLAELREPAREKPEKKHYATVAERVAQSSVCWRNHKFNGAAEAFPHEPAMRSVDQFYPYALGGALHVDQPTTQGEKADCARKAKAMAERGMRYLVIEPDMDESEAVQRLRG